MNDWSNKIKQRLPYALAPAPVCPTLAELFRKRSFLQEKDLAELFAEQFLVSNFYLLGSGKESIFRLLLAIKSLHQNKEYIILAAYTCPEIAAAIVRAGFKIALIDFFPNSIKLNWDSVSVDLNKIAAVVLSNLYGLADDCHQSLEVSKKHNFYIIDDACQGIFSKDTSGNVGFRGDFGIFSFARGKCLSGVSAGALTINHKEIFAYQKIVNFLDALPTDLAGLPASIKDLTNGFFINLLARPNLYWVTKYLPFLGLGKTNCEINFKINRPSKMACYYALIQLNDLERLKSSAQQLSVSWRLYLRGLDIVDLYDKEKENQENILLRYPILINKPEKREELVRKLSKYGVSFSYPGTLETYPVLKDNLIFKDISQAKKVAKSIVTLPIHSYVNEHVQRKVVKEIIGILAD